MYSNSLNNAVPDTFWVSPYDTFYTNMESLIRYLLKVKSILMN